MTTIDGDPNDPTLRELRERLRVGSELVFTSRHHGPYFHKVVEIVERGVVCDIYMKDWTTCLGHRSLYEWDRWRMKLR